MNMHDEAGAGRGAFGSVRFRTPKPGPAGARSGGAAEGAQP
jgi:hypothetical protein